MHGTGDLTGLALVMGAALLCGLGMRRLGQPPVVGYILAGVLLGPSVLGLVSDRETVTFLAELGVLLLLFLVAMEMSLYAFRDVWKVSVGATALQIAIGVAVLVPFVLLGQMAWGEAAVLGFVIALSSTAVVIKLLEQTNILRQPVGRLAIGVLIAQDLAVVPLLIGVNVLAAGAIDGWMALKFVGALAAVSVLVWFLARRKRLVIPMVHEDTLPELVALGGLAFCFGGAALTGFLGLTPALGAFLAGLVIGNSTARHPMIVSTRPIQGVLLMVFFLSVGLLIDFTFLAQRWEVILLLLLAVTVVKTAINIGILALLREPWPHAFIAGVLLAQIGEFSLVIAGTAERGGIITRDLVQTIVAVMALSLLLAPLWLFATRRLLRVVVLGMTSLHDTLDAIRSQRLAVAWRALVAVVAVGARVTAATLGGVWRGAVWIGRGVAGLFRRRPRESDGDEGPTGRSSPLRRRPGDTLTPRGVAPVDDAPENPRFPPPDGSSPGGAQSDQPLSGRPPPARSMSGAPPPGRTMSGSPALHEPLQGEVLPAEPPSAETPRDAPPADGGEPRTIPRPDSPSSALRGLPTGPGPETPRYPSPEGPVQAEAPSPEKKSD